MRIAVNTRFLIKDKLAGLGHFTNETLVRMVRKHPEVEFLFLFDRDYSDEFVFADNVTPVKVAPPARHPLLFYAWFEFGVPRALRKYKPDLFLSMDNFMSLRLNIPTALVIHDLAFEHYPMDVKWSERKYYHHFMPKFAKKAKRIASVSDATKQDIVKTYNIDAGKIDPVYVGFNTDFVPANEEVKAATKAKFSEGCDYFIFVGTIQPRKNLVHMMKAFEAFKHKHAGNLKLLITGKKGWKTEEIYKTYESLQCKSDVHFPGRVSSEDLGNLIGSSIGLLCVSYFEGFGMPILEANACEVPVITANVSSMPEVAGDAACLVDPFSIDSIQEGMEKITFDRELAGQLVERGRENIKRFSWDRTSDALWDCMVKALD